MRRLTCFGMVGFLGLAIAFGNLAQAAPTAVPKTSEIVTVSPVPVAARAERGSVFFLRGLLNVFSRGMDRLSNKLEAKGIQSRVTNYSHWQQFAVLLVSNYRTDKSLAPVVIVGHSLGADAAVNMGNYLATRGVPVRLIVLFDAVDGASKPGAGIAEVVNYYKSDGVGKVVKVLPSFTGKLVNIDVSDRKDIDHLNIDKASSLHDEVIANVVSIFGKL